MNHPQIIATAGAAPRNPAGPAPMRKPNSVRRTSSIDVTWPEGRDAPAHFAGHARDIHTPASSRDPVVLGEDRLSAILAPDRTIRTITATPQRPGVDALVGERGGGYLRSALENALPAEREAGSPLYLLIDDLSGTSLICQWAWSRWLDGASLFNSEEARQRRASMGGICTGFREGSSALTNLTTSSTPVPPLPNPEDPAGWHELTEYTQASMRRARRIDVWVEAGTIHIDAGFQDSASEPTGGRTAVHEYQLQATADIATMTLTSVVARPCILPYPECTSAPDNLNRLLGTPLRELRSTVLEKLRRIDGCTHLNDAMRALAEVPILFASLDT